MDLRVVAAVNSMSCNGTMPRIYYEARDWVRMLYRGPAACLPNALEHIRSRLLLAWAGKQASAAVTAMARTVHRSCDIQILRDSLSSNGCTLARFGLVS